MNTTRPQVEKRIKVPKADKMNTMPGTTVEEVQHNFHSLQIDLSSSEPGETLPAELTSGLSTRQSSKDDELSIVIGREPPHRFRSMSPAFLQLFRFKSQDLSSASLRILFGPDTDATSIRSAIANPPLSCSRVVLYRKDGEEIHCSMRASHGTDEEACTLFFEMENSCSASPQPSTPKLCDVRPIENGCSRVGCSAAEAQTPCSLLSEDAMLDYCVAIRALRNAAAAAGRRYRHVADIGS